MVLRYKPDEGRNTRQAAFWLGSAMIAFGSYSLRGFLNGWVGLRNPITSAMERVPILGVDLNASLLIAVIAFVALMVIWLRFLARARVADHLIEVENEIRKVTWPSFKEASNSSIVVIATVLILMGFLAFSDWALGVVFNQILFHA
jgi:preprotein translocase SecE subunit